MGSASSRPASRRRRLPRPNASKWTIASLLVCGGGSPSTAAHTEMEDDSSNLLVNSSIQGGESTVVSGLRTTPVYESDLISGTRVETEASNSNTCGDIWSGFMHHEEELEESCSDHISVENHASDVSTSYNHVPIRLPSHEHINVNVSDTEEDEEEDEQDIDDEGQTGRMVSILSSSSSPPETSYRLTRENSRRLFWDAFSRRNSIRRHRGDSIAAAAAADGLGSHDRFLFDFDLSADSSDDDQGNRIHSSSIQRLQSQSEFWERLYANRRRRSSSRRTRTCPSGLHDDGTCSCDSTSGGEEPDTRASVSRIVMLAEALFEVLDEIHRQPVSLSLSVVSLPAPGSVVDSFPTKNHRKLNNAQDGDDIPQCYICLDEYEDGDEIRVLPCRHEYHMGCIDKWLKEIHGVCPLCRGDVCQGLSDRPITSSL
ncbi:E3 ubiquitin ligase BIG BROTHER-related-like [Impatiens glandulifera]|uniref:E3 ubiquitin ligase BIG BROTHER-related-like n=1 Tax=Impatiens glandulifera TaxID=253017 RepID=UPI001FB0EBA0|nr:E3 ubiquitin ligase BIG BROTHER-related-like [Impatiens glandulifera]